jgi:hypothetical protein
MVMYKNKSFIHSDKFKGFLFVVNRRAKKLLFHISFGIMNSENTEGCWILDLECRISDWGREIRMVNPIFKEFTIFT